MAQGLVDAMARVLRVSEEPLHAAFLSRSFNALARLAPELSEDVLSEVVGEPSDYEVLLRALEEPKALETLGREAPLAEARLGDLALRKTILESDGGILTVQQVAERLGISRQAVDKRRRAGQILALPVGQHRYVYPTWQFAPNGVQPGFGDALAELSLPDPWTKAAFFLGKNVHLDGRRPLE